MQNHTSKLVDFPLSCKPLGYKWIDIGATCHVYSNKILFTSLKPIKNEEKLFMGNSTMSKIQGKGKVIMKWTSEKKLILNNMLYVPDIRKKSSIWITFK